MAKYPNGYQASNTKGEIFEVISKVPKCRDYIIKFIATGYVKQVRTDKIKSGLIKDLCVPIVFGRGYMGDGTYKAKIKGVMTQQYNAWTSMLQRCYDPKTHNPAYDGVTVCDEWMDYQVFAKWYDNNMPSGIIPGVDIVNVDKDILAKGNKIYHPDKCCIATPFINCMLAYPKATNGKYPAGVGDRVGNGKLYYTAGCGSHDRYIGCYATPELAHQAWRTHKIGDIHNKAKIAYESKHIKENVYQALLSWVI